MGTRNWIFSMLIFISVDLISCFVAAQGSINNLKIIPQNPVMSDTIHVVGNVTINSAPCTLLNITHFLNGNNLVVNAYHCYGMLSVLCNSSDTCKINPLLPGTYNLTFYLWTGYSCPSPPMLQCVDTAHSTFTVTLVSEVPEYFQRAEIIIYPNPNRGDFFLSTGIGGGELMILTADGRLLDKRTLVPGKNEVSLDLAPGLYLSVFHQKDSFSFAAPFSIIR
jgi:hypothetical protein